jgi:hypothetical protein
MNSLRVRSGEIETHMPTEFMTCHDPIAFIAVSNGAFLASSSISGISRRQLVASDQLLGQERPDAI